MKQNKKEKLILIRCWASGARHFGDTENTNINHLGLQRLIKAIHPRGTKHWLLVMSIQWSWESVPLFRSQFLLLESQESETHDFQGDFQS